MSIQCDLNIKLFIELEAWKARVEAFDWHEESKSLLRKSFVDDTVLRAYLACTDDLRTSSWLWPFDPIRTRAARLMQRRMDFFNALWWRLWTARCQGTNNQGLRTDESEGNYKKKLFIVHGRDVATRESVARFILQIGLEPIILEEQPNRGLTIIEKLEHHSDVLYAVILLTADDYGYLKGDAVPAPRPRQNVVLELGYFVAKLGRSRVCILHGSELQTPSDIDGVVYIPMDNAGAWRLMLAKELTTAGFKVDLKAIV
jgi:predicted nucleotide-binding protein with TIR-like domain